MTTHGKESEPIMNSPVEKTEPVSYRWTEGDYGEWKFANYAPDDGAYLENFEPLYSASTVEALKAENAALLSRVERMEKALKPIAGIVTDQHNGGFKVNPQNLQPDDCIEAYRLLQETKP
jgi:hypothetical protein